MIDLVINKNEFDYKYHKFAHDNFTDDNGNSVIVFLIENMKDTGPVYLMTEVGSDCIIFGVIPDYTKYYHMEKYDEGLKHISNVFNGKNIYDYIDSDNNIKAILFDAIELCDFIKY